MFAPQRDKPNTSNTSVASVAQTNASVNTSGRVGVPGNQPGMVTQQPLTGNGMQQAPNASYGFQSPQNSFSNSQQPSMINASQQSGMQQGNTGNNQQGFQNSAQPQSFIPFNQTQPQNSQQQPVMAGNNNNMQQGNTGNNQQGFQNPQPQYQPPGVSPQTPANQNQPGAAGQPSAQAKPKTYPAGLKKTSPSLAPSSNFQTSCQKTPQPTNKAIIPWDHSKKNFVYGEQELNLKNKLSKQDLASGMSTLYSSNSWNPVATYEMCLIILIVWVILVIAAVLLISLVWPSEFGVKSYEWIVIVGGVIAIIFGVVLLICTKKYADQLAWEKRLEMFGVLDRLEQVNLKDTGDGIRPGKDGAWIEYGPKANLGRLLLTQTGSDPTLWQRSITSRYNQPKPPSQSNRTSQSSNSLQMRTSHNSRTI